MRSWIKGSIAVVGALALAGTAAAQQGGPPPGGGQGGGQGGPPRQGGGGGGGGPGGPGGPPAPFTGKPVFAKLVGSNGAGQVTVVIDEPKGTACYIMNVTHLADVTAAHIHQGAAGQTGNPVVTLKAPTEGTSGGCETIAANLAQAILANPAGYYVNVHTRTAPAGAIRGQLAGDITRPLPK